jgi:N-acylneuraminate cytidylyltransferase
MVIAFIPLRGGSKSIPGKNINNFCGKPLCYWSIYALQQSTSVDKIVVATDDDTIKQTAARFGFDKLVIYDRLPENAKDSSSTESVMLEYLSNQPAHPADLFILVQATNPFTTSANIDEAVEAFRSNNYDSLLSCVLNKRFYWNKNGTPYNYNYTSRPRRQDFEGMYMENGAFYVSSVAAIVQYSNRLSGNIGIYEMPEFTAFEIDEPDDWIIMEQLFRRHLLQTFNKAKPIRLFITDVDGVLTDAGMYYSEAGDELKKFNTHDGMGLQLLRIAGIKTAIITTENTQLVERRAKKLRVDHLYQGKAHGSKLESALEICNIEGIDISEAAYIGDDINCKELLESVGIAACPANALAVIKNIPGILQLNKAGGDGAVREFIEWLIAHKKLAGA